MTALDHLVVAARTLDQGLAWCEATFGFVPAAGGAHPLMGTHNRVFAIGSPAFPSAYFEIIAIDPAAPPPGRVRWFDLDDPDLQRSLAEGPRLVHWVLRCDDVEARVARLRSIGVDRGEVLAASRGTLHWRISVRSDGARLADGALPTLITWDSPHPTDTLPPSGVALQAFECAGLAAPMARECAAPGVRFTEGAPRLSARFHTPRGDVALHS